MSIGFAAYIFDGSSTAGEQLRHARGAEALDLEWLTAVAVIERHGTNAVTVRSTSSVAGRTPVARTDVARLTGAFAAALTNAPRWDERALDDLAASLEPETSALVLVGDTPDFVDAFDHTGARLIEGELQNVTIAHLQRLFEADDAVDRRFGS